jgi:hypothetical protein
MLVAAVISEWASSSCGECITQLFTSTALGAPFRCAESLAREFLLGLDAVREICFAVTAFDGEVLVFFSMLSVCVGLDLLQSFLCVNPSSE